MASKTGWAGTMAGEQRNQSDEQVMSKRGKGWFTAILLIGSWVLVGTWFLIEELFTYPIGTWRDYWMPATGLLLGWLILIHIATERIVLTKDGLIVRSLTINFFVRWRDISEIRVAPLFGNTLFWGYNIWVMSPMQRKAIQVTASLYHNRHDLVKKIIEMSARANPNTRILYSLLDVYGPPPYNK